MNGIKGGSIMLKKLDDLLFKVLHLEILGFLLYGGLVYAPESPATLILSFIAVLVVFWVISYILLKVNDKHIDKKIERHYR